MRGAAILLALCFTLLNASTATAAEPWERELPRDGATCPPYTVASASGFCRPAASNRTSDALQRERREQRRRIGPLRPVERP
jgi:hypothetical protein